MESNRPFFKTGFSDFLDYDSLYQKRTALYAYKNLDCGVSFVHDFDKFRPLAAQIDAVRNKYNERIKRLFGFIQEPSLLIRYCFNQDELIYMAENYDEIVQNLKSYNKDNELLIITHSDPVGVNDDLSKIKMLFFIEPDEDDETINTKPIKSNETLYGILNSAPYEKRDENLNFMRKQADKKAKYAKSLWGMIKLHLNKHARANRKEYIHYQQCD